MIKLPDIQHLSLQRVREIAEGSTPLMGEVQRLAVTALGYFEENKSAVKAFQSTGFILLEREQELEEALAEVQRLNATAQPVSDGLYRIANHIAGAKNSLPQEWQDWAEEIESDLRKLAAAPGGQDD